MKRNMKGKRIKERIYIYICCMKGTPKERSVKRKEKEEKGNKEEGKKRQGVESNYARGVEDDGENTRRGLKKEWKTRKQIIKERKEVGYKVWEDGKLIL